MAATIRRYYYDYEDVEVKIGDTVFFKADVEQAGRVVAIEDKGYPQGWVFTLESFDGSGFEGEYIGGQTRTSMRADDCWL
jgi:hypothetical protein